jgi:hypothetical protein
MVSNSPVTPYRSDARSESRSAARRALARVSALMTRPVSSEAAISRWAARSGPIRSRTVAAAVSAR